MMIESMADAAVLMGMKRDVAYTFAAQAVLGAAKMVLETKEHPGILKDKVCSPGGTTIEGVKELEEKNFRAAVIDASVAVAKKSKSMNK
jgi:pyrroline-5-carboxylate reductase